MYNSIRPGKVWLDTNGKRIHAHGGTIFFRDGRYYWYGENKEKSVKGADIWHWGVRYYTSVDLYNWEDRGLLIPPDTEHPGAPLHPRTQMDRPHILYNVKTRKYVCWLKIMHSLTGQSMTVLSADRFEGPYKIVKTGYQPFNMNTGDFDLGVDQETDRAYFFFEKVHTELIIAELSDDYLSVAGHFTSHFPHGHPPVVREAPVHFTRNGKHYLFTSGTSGYFPNPSEVAVADDWHGPYRVLGNPHVQDKTETSFSSQITDVFCVHGKEDRYIVIADRWLPRFPRSRFVSRMVRNTMNRMFSKPIAEKKGNSDSQNVNKPLDNSNTAMSDYVWLPLRFDGEMPIIDWKKEWKIEDI
jgi:hypothetical protein